MLIEIAGWVVKLLGAFYGASLLLAVDVLFGVFVWFRFLSGDTEHVDRLRSISVIVMGVLIAAAASGPAWYATGKLLSVYQGLETTAPGRIAIFAAVVVLAVKDLLLRFLPFPRNEQARLPLRGDELFFEQGVSHSVLLLLTTALCVGMPGSPLIDSAGAMILSFTLIGLTVRVIYFHADKLFTPSSGES